MFDSARIWFLSWTAYGEWLPGDARGFVGRVTDRRSGEAPGPRRRHNRAQTEYDRGIAGLTRRSREAMSGPPVRLSAAQATALADQFEETASFRGWRLLATAVMAQHVHLLIGVPGDPDPDVLLRDFKSYGSRALNRFAGAKTPGRWWTRGGSTRKKADAEAILDAAAYVRDQEHPLAVRVAEDVADVIGPRGCEWRERAAAREAVAGANGTGD